MNPQHQYPPQLGGDKNDSWTTPEAIFSTLNNEFAFTLDVAASKENALCPRFYTQEDNALQQPWGSMNWCNPPYSIVTEFIDKAILEAVRGCTTVFLVLAKTETRWFKKAWQNAREIRFITGRIKFGHPDKLVKNSPTYGSVIIVIGPGATGTPRVSLIERDALLGCS